MVFGGGIGIEVDAGRVVCIAIKHHFRPGPVHEILGLAAANSPVSPIERTRGRVVVSLSLVVPNERARDRLGDPAHVDYVALSLVVPEQYVVTVEWALCLYRVVGQLLPPDPVR
jgi:hypothetical protein